MRADRDTLWFNQSDIQNYVMCPEQYRRDYDIQPGGDFTDEDRDTNLVVDSQLVGSVFHEAIYHDLSEPGFWSLGELGQLVEELFISIADKAVSEGRFLFSGWENYSQAVAAAQKLVARWYVSDIRAHYSSLRDEDPEMVILEESFDVPFTELDGRYKHIRLVGTPDLVDLQAGVVVDWKSGNRKFLRWEKQRWDVQPTVYTFANRRRIEPVNGLWFFQFAQWVHSSDDPNPATVDVQRSEGQWAHMKATVAQMVAMLEGNVTTWPLRDNGWWCGPKWCPHWDTCKGANVSEDWT